MKPAGASPQQRTLIVAGCALILPVILVLVLLIRDQFEARRAQVESDALDIAREIAVVTDARLGADLQVMRVLSVSPALARGDLSALRERAATILETNPGWTSLKLVDRRAGAVVVTTDPDNPEAPAIPEDLTFAGRIGGVERDGPGCPCVSLYMPTPMMDGHALVVTLDPLIFQRMMLQRVSADVVAAVVDRDGRFAARSLDYSERVGLPATSYVRKAVARGGVGFYEGRTYEGLANVSAFATAPLSGWSAHVAIDRALIAGPRTLSVVAMLAGSIVALAVGGVMIFYAFKEFALRRREEARMLELQKAEAIGQFTGTVVHDFRNLLAVMQASLNLIDRNTAEDRTREAVRLAREALDRGARLTSQLLSFARSDEAQGEIGSVDLPALVARIDDMLRKLLGGRIELVVRIGPGARLVLANADQLELALVNLAANARDAIGGPGRVTLTAERDGDRVRLRFADTGPGFPPEVLPELFRPYFTTKPPGKGTGLGLAQVAGAVRQAGGEISAENGPDGGGVFVLTLRAADAGANAEQPAGSAE